MWLTKTAEYVTNTPRPLTTFCVAVPCQHPQNIKTGIIDQVSTSTGVCVKTLSHESNWLNHKPTKVIENKNATIFFGFSHRLDVVVKNHNGNTCFLIDMSVHSDSNVSLKIFEKLSNCKDLETEVAKCSISKQQHCQQLLVHQIQWQRLPLNCVSQIPGAPSLTELQKITLMGTAHIPPKVLSNVILYSFVILFFMFFIFLYYFLFFYLFIFIYLFSYYYFYFFIFFLLHI